MNKRRRYKAKRRRVIAYWSEIYNHAWLFPHYGSMGLTRSRAAGELRHYSVFVGMYAR